MHLKAQPQLVPVGPLSLLFFSHVLYWSLTEIKYISEIPVKGAKSYTTLHFSLNFAYSLRSVIICTFRPTQMVPVGPTSLLFLLHVFYWSLTEIKYISEIHVKGAKSCTILHFSLNFAYSLRSVIICTLLLATIVLPECCFYKYFLSGLLVIYSLQLSILLILRKD
jgi:hypothetical protein